MAKAKAATGTAVEILEIERGRVTVGVVGTTPFICNRVSEKARRELLMPKGRKTAADKAQSLKHNPLEEYRNSAYRLDDNDAPTLIAFLAPAFKRAMMTAALDVPGTKKAQVGRLIRVEGERIPMYGIPKMLIAITRSADINKTPDIRTRAILPEWATILDISYPTAIFREKAILNLFGAAGVFSGVGDWRTEKGSANYGSFRTAGVDDKDLKRIIATGGRAAQIKAMNAPQFYDDESEEMFTWFQSEAAERGLKVAS